MRVPVFEALSSNQLSCNRMNFYGEYAGINEIYCYEITII